MSRLSVLLAEPNPGTRNLMQEWFAAEPDWRFAAEAARPAEVLELVEAYHPDVVVLNLHLGGLGGGVPVTRRLVRDFPRSRILVTASSGNLSSALHAGAGGIYLHSYPPGWLPVAVRTVAGGGVWLHPEVRELLAGRWRPEGPAGRPAQPLGRREVDALRCLAAGATPTEAARTLAVPVQVVDQLLDQAVRKLGVATLAQAVVLAHAAGFVATPPAAAATPRNLVASRSV